MNEKRKDKKRRKNFYKEQFSRRAKSNKPVLQPEEAYRFARRRSKRGYKKARSVRITKGEVDKVCYSISEAARSIALRSGEDVDYKSVIGACASGDTLHGFKCKYTT